MLQMSLQEKLIFLLVNLLRVSSDDVHVLTEAFSRIIERFFLHKTPTLLYRINKCRLLDLLEGKRKVMTHAYDVKEDQWNLNET